MDLVIYAFTLQHNIRPLLPVPTYTEVVPTPLFFLEEGALYPITSNRNKCREPTYLISKLVIIHNCHYPW